MACTTGWRVTGYYSPEEVQFSGPPVTVALPEGQRDEFPEDFLAEVRVEGWGRTRHGWFLGLGNSGWVTSAYPQDALGKPLRIGSLAVDVNQIALGAAVTIPDAATPWDKQDFAACDTGGDISGQHVDIYCGVGPDALRETFRVTASGRTVCVT